MYWMAGTFTQFSVFPIWIQTQEMRWGRRKWIVMERWVNGQRGGLAHVLVNSQDSSAVAKPHQYLSQPLWHPLQTQSVLDKTPGLGCCLHGTRLMPRHSSESFQASELFLAALAFNHNYELSLLISSYWCLQVSIFTRAKEVPDSEKMYSILAGTSCTSELGTGWQWLTALEGQKRLLSWFPVEQRILPSGSWIICMASAELSCNV